MLSVFRSSKNPFLTPSRTRAYAALGAFNPSAVEKDGRTHLFYRALSEPDDLRTPGRGFSTVGYTVCDADGTSEEHRQVLKADQAWDTYGCEDPRATFFEGKWYVFYTALGGYPFSADNIKVAVAIGNAPDELTEKHLVTPFNAKAATLFPERIDGDIVLLLTAHTDYTEEHPRPSIAIARAKHMEDFWDESFWNTWHHSLAEHSFPDLRRNDTEHVEVGAAPIRTDSGWLLIYSHIQNYYDERHRIFGIEAVLLDITDPRIVLAQTPFPFLVPEEFYERYGLIGDIVFPSGVLRSGDKLTVYYGAADMVGATATLSLPHLLESMVREKRDTFLARATTEPILVPKPEHHWESFAVCNAAAVDIDGSVHLLYRAITEDNYSVMGYARLEDGVRVVERLDTPAYVSRIPEESHGVEDPRLTLVDDRLYLAYTAFNGSIARCALSSISVDDFVAKKFNWSEPQLLTPDTVNDKDVCIVPGRVGGQVMIIHRIDPNISADFFTEFPPEGTITQSIDLLTPRPGMWDAVKVGAAAAPIRVEEGLLFVYHAVGPDYVYRLGAALLDGETGTTVLARTAFPIIEPVLPWERNGQVNNVVFSCGMVLRDDTLFIYYGGADMVIGVATVSKKELLTRLVPVV